MTRTARDAALPYLYHYEKFVAEYLIDVLTNARIHCSDPAELNDPWDCRPWFDDAEIDEPEFIDALIEWLFSCGPVSLVSDNIVAATQHVIRTDPTYRRQVLMILAEHFHTLIPRRWGMYCLTPVRDSTLMWSHYADNHRGICLEFATDSPLLGMAQEVNYLSEYPSWSPMALATGNSTSVLLTKSDDWTYEQEFRIITFGDNVQRSVDFRPLVMDGRYLKLPEGALRAVIVGCEADYERIRNLVTAHTCNVKVKRAVRSPRKYRLIIEEDTAGQG